MSTWQNKLDLFADNTQAVKKGFFWWLNSIKRLAALLYTQEGKAVDCDSIQQCRALIKQNTGVFSQFRSNMSLCLATLLSLSPNPQERLDETLKVYDLLKGVKFHASDYLVIAAYQIAAQSDASDYGNVVARTRSFYDEMKARHFFLTGADDYIFAAMLALTDLESAAGAECIERIFTQLKGKFWDDNSVQTLAQVLALGNSDESVTERVLTLRDAFKVQKIKLHRSLTLPFLGVLALLPAEIDAIVSDVDAALSALKLKKGFGALSIDSGELLLFAASIVAGDYAQSTKDGILTTTLQTSLTNLIIAQQVALVVMICATTSASVTAASR
ncbi:hypothetical protein FACS1894105_08710 [Clostridia bacterium]|nr:hypothetical protein FACS1894105_08710 [Clostridia bacterium]